MCVAGIPGRDAVPSIEGWHKAVSHKAVGVGDARYPSESELFDQPVLEGFEESFDSSFGLRRKGEDQCNPEGFHGPLKLCFEVRIGNGNPLGHFVGGETVKVDFAGQAVHPRILGPEPHNREYAFVRDKGKVEEVPGGVINPGKQAGFRDAATSLEPVVVAAVKLDECATPAPPFPPGSVDRTGCAPTIFCRRPETFRDHEGADRFRVMTDAVFFTELLSGKGGAEVRIPGTENGYQTVAFHLRNSTLARASATAVHETEGAPVRDPADPSSDGTVSHAEKAGCL